MMPELHRLLVCPSCRGDFARAAIRLRCRDCGTGYEIVDGIPVLLPAQPGSPDVVKSGQATYFDNAVEEEFEITRPHGTPRLYRWLMEYKFQRGISELREIIADGTVLVVCAGSGMDAEFLSRSGGRPIALDLSVGAVHRSVERGRRYSIPIAGVVADVESLPFRDASIDVVYVHDGLHHLPDPLKGVREMARVARTAVSVNEPVDALATRFAVRLGLAVDTEEAGNRVARIALDAVTAELAAHGIHVVKSGRYIMYYAHRPGRVAAALSLRGVFPLMTAALLGVNRVAGAVGNKGFLQGRRLVDAAPTAE
jgi:SAM-dependent methyltransferase/uncharacterized protein YbaR (Trm112 family)